ncbi:MAG: class I SAM-dependent RNA methyltransferase, partial [Vallitaleaceae bacterium]|nr:class I SAM-dependent RNA methyltransferase [Vallitaleaceae bacterium]
MSEEKMIPVVKNESYTITIEDLTVEGEGVGKVEGYALFVPGGLPGDTLEVKVLKTKKSYGYAKIERIVKPSDNRCVPMCPIAIQCGGCQLQHLRYKAQLSFKRSKVEEALKRIGGFEGIKVEETIGMGNPYHYRNKAQYPVREV